MKTKFINVPHNERKSLRIKAIGNLKAEINKGTYDSWMNDPNLTEPLWFYLYRDKDSYIHLEITQAQAKALVGRKLKFEKPSHTPGPWHVFSFRNEGLDMTHRVKAPNALEVIGDFKFADACLIASAPDLLEALKRCWAECEMSESLVSYVEGVILKAEPKAN